MLFLIEPLVPYAWPLHFNLQMKSNPKHMISARKTWVSFYLSSSVYVFFLLCTVWITFWLLPFHQTVRIDWWQMIIIIRRRKERTTFKYRTMFGTCAFMWVCVRMCDLICAIQTQAWIQLSRSLNIDSCSIVSSPTVETPSAIVSGLQLYITNLNSHKI